MKDLNRPLTANSGENFDIPERTSTSEMQGKLNDIKRLMGDSLHGIRQPVAGEQQKPIAMTEHRQEQVLSKPLPHASFLEQAHAYIKEAMAIVKTTQTSLTADGYIRPLEYSNQFNSLHKIKKEFEEFRDLIDKTPQLPEAITLGHELLRVKVNTAIGHIEEVKSCIEDFASPCQNIEQRFEALSSTLNDLGRHCKIEN